MAKELPYFKFIATEWLTGNICFEPYEVQGLFINICALYWNRGGILKLSEIEQRYKKKHIIAKLTDRFFSLNDGFIMIEFLDEQLTERQYVSKKNSDNGKKGGRPTQLENKANANPLESDLKAKKSNIEEEKNKNKNKNKNKIKNIEERKQEFYNSLTPFLELYSKELLRNFYSYWSEHGENDKKMRLEKEKSFSVERRLVVWSNNEVKFNKEKNSGQKESRIDAFMEQTAEQLRINQALYGTE